MKRVMFLVTLVAAGFCGRWEAQAGAPDAAPLTGQWTLDRSHSEFPTEVGFNATFAPAPAAGGDAGGGRSGGRGRAPRSGAQAFPRPDSQEDARRIQILTDEVRTPPVNLTIADAGSTVTVTADGYSRTLHPNGREESIQINGAPVVVVATRVEGNLVVVYRVADGRDLRYTYWRAATSPQLVIDVVFVERGQSGSIRRVYAPGTASTPTTAAPASAESMARGWAPATGNASPRAAVDQRPDAALKGITTLGVTVEELSPQATSCRLTRDAIEAAAASRLSNAGLTVAHNTNAADTTYLYINVMTTSAASGLCVSRYDVSLYTHTTATLSYRDTPVLVQVLLTHAGGLSGGSAASHADGVMGGVAGYVDEIIGRIQAANR